MKAFVLAGLGMLVPDGAPAPPADSAGWLSGRVCDAYGTPVANAIVRVSSSAQAVQTISDANGRYCFIGLAQDTYALTVEKTGYAQGMYVGIHVAAGQRTTADAVLNIRLIRWIVHRDFASDPYRAVGTST